MTTPNPSDVMAPPSPSRQSVLDVAQPDWPARFDAPPVNPQRESARVVRIAERLVKTARPVETILVDLDDTLCDTSHRHHLVEEGNWRQYSLECGGDAPIEFTIEMVNLWAGAGYDIALVSGRDEVARDFTIEWLKDNHVHWHGLYLRQEGDRSHNAKLKRKIALMLIAKGAKILWALDDNPEVVESYGKLGIATLLVDRPSKTWGKNPLSR